MFRFAVLVSAVFLLTVKAQNIQIFGNETIKTVYHSITVTKSIDEDQYICGNFLVFLADKVITTNFITEEIIYASPNGASLSYSYFQKSPTELLMTSPSGECIQLLNRTNNQISTWAGEYGSAGTNTGDRLTTARFTEITDIKLLRPNLLLVVDRGWKRVLGIDMVDGNVSIASPQMSSPFTIALHHSNSSLAYVTDTNKLFLVHLWEGFKSTIAGGKPEADGDLSTAGFSDLIRDLTWVNNNTAMLVSEIYGGLKLLDWSANNLTTLCVGDRVDRSGPFGVCTIQYVKKQLVIGNLIYLAPKSGISVIEASIYGESETGKMSGNFVREACTSTQCGFTDVSISVRNRPDCAEQCLNRKFCVGFRYQNGKCDVMISMLSKWVDYPKDANCYVKSP